MSVPQRLLELAKKRLLAPMQLSRRGTIHVEDVFGPKQIALYVHFPFCNSMCAYCSFNKVRPRGQLDGYVDALEKEIAYYGAEPHLSSVPVHAVFLGGGTPSFLPAELIERTLAALRRHFNFLPDAQITVETNPESTSIEKLSRYRRAGANRISVGVQSFDERLLRGLGRRHRTADIHAALDAVAAAGFRELSLDLMFGLPGQTAPQLAADLAHAIASPITHLSLFAMIYRPGTPLWRRRVRSRPLWRMYDFAAEHLARHGFTQYTAEDFTRSGVHCRYQDEVWRAGPKGFLGFGAGAMSMYGSSGWHNIGPVDDYIAAAREGGRPVAGGGNSSTSRQMLEHLMASARSLRIDTEPFAERFGVDLASLVGPLPRLLELAGLLRRETDAGFTVTRRGAFLVSVLWGELVLQQCADAARATGRAIPRPPLTFTPPALNYSPPRVSVGEGGYDHGE